eukprot:NODE_815_length_1354_cov_261.565820.p1 GENE.NODE_815_length_1354_cov_261.565820~~NODE_815_length_1354_cov_261.565820.p1  ORF type:complete len:397 (-),score=88.99 NODE_815_length_1354_cov_261.565820:146-1336(-)
MGVALVIIPTCEMEASGSQPPGAESLCSAAGRTSPPGPDIEATCAGAEKGEPAPFARSRGVPLIGKLHLGPVDIVGDVHGECGALCALLDRLGYDGDGGHPEGRRLVFVGDLIDRGPDSPGVVRLVRHLVERGNAQCILGNHELNLMRGKRRHGNHWAYGETEALCGQGAAVSFQVLADAAFRNEMLAFFGTLPLALEREDLVVVHAAWDAASVSRLRVAYDGVVEAYSTFEREVEERIVAEAIADEDERELLRQNDNPVKVVTSGYEQRAAKPFFAGGKMRNLGRARWWEEYTAEDGRLVVIGHYWRRFLDEVNAHVPEDSLAGENMFPGYSASELLGPVWKVACVDFSVGLRYQERGMGLPEGALGTQITALRHPEMTLHRGDGHIVECTRQAR